MADTFLQDARLTLLGAGFLGDAEAQDGVHLRWSFDPELGFPSEGFQLYFREPARKTTLKVSFTALAKQLQQQGAPAAVESGVTVHRADGDRLPVATRCEQVGLDLAGSPLVLRFRPTFGTPPGLVREVTLLGTTQQGAAFAQALHAGRVADCAAIGQQLCLGQILDSGTVAQLTRLDAGDRVLAGRHLRQRRRATRVTWAALVRAERADALRQLADLGAGTAAAAGCVPFQLTLRADVIDAVRISGCNATLLGAVWSPFARDESEAGWKPLHGPLCLPVNATPGYGCSLGPGDARSIAKNRIPQEAELPPAAPRRAELEQRLLGADFDELHHSLEQAIGSGGQLVVRLASDDPGDGTSWRYDVVRDALTAAADPYFARVLGLYWVHKPSTPPQRFDYMVEAVWPVNGEKRRFCFIVFDRGPEAQPALAAPTGPSATAMPGSAHVTPDGVLNPCEMDVVVNWRRPSVCEVTDALRTPMAYLVERTDAGAPGSGPYHLVTKRAFEAGGEPEVVPAIIADADDGAERFASGYFVDRGPGYGLFHYRVRGRDLFGRTSAPSAAAPVTVTDQVAPGPPLNLAAEYFDPADPERAGSDVLAWASRDAAPGDPPRAAVALRWIWPASRQLQFPDLDEFRLYYRSGSLNHVLGRITAVSQAAASEYDVVTDMAPVGPDIPAPQAAVDPGALRNEGEEYAVLTIVTVAGRLTFRVRANPAAPPLVGPCAFRLGRGTSPTATQAARAPYAAFKTFEQPAHWEGFLLDASAPPKPLRIAADGALRGALPSGLAASDVDIVRALETQDGAVYWHYLLRLRGLTLEPTAERPRAAGAFGIGAVDGVPNEGRIAPPASILAVRRVTPAVPPIVYPPVNYATLADYHGTSYFQLEWTGVAGAHYLVYRAGDLDLLASGGVDLATHRARTADEQRLELQQLGLDPAHVEAFRIVTAAPLVSAGGPMRHRDPLPGALRNRFVYRLRATDAGGNLAPWPPAASASCVVVDLPGVPPPPPAWADTSFPATGGVVLRWVPHATAALRGYRLYRSDDADRARDVRSMTSLFPAAQDEGAGGVTGVLVTRDATGAITGITPLAPGERPPGRLVQFLDTTAPPGRAIYYRLVAEDTNGHRSAASERLVVQAPKSAPPEPPAWVAPALGPSSVALQWTAAESDLECLVLRRTDGSIRRALGPWSVRGAYTFVDTDVEAGTDYQYSVRVRDRVGHVVDGPVLNVTAI
jgi:hypothetical protein